jgi:hypothetical protein
MIDPTKRIDKWDAKFDTTAIKATLDKIRPRMLESVSAVTPLITAMELQVKQVCDLQGATVIQLPFYLCFGREMWAMTRKEISGEAAAVEAATLISKWVSRGLLQPVLEVIRTGVFNVAAPSTP